MEAIILAGGRGTRLSGIVSDLPKPMAPIAGRPFLTYLFTSLLTQGFTQVCLSTGYMADSIESYYGANFEGLKISYSREEVPLGTGGGIRLALQQTSLDNVFVFNGDSLSVLDLPDMMRLHNSTREKTTVALCYVPDTSRYGAVQFVKGRIVSFSEKGTPGPGYINAGIYILQRDVFAGLDLPDAFSFEQQFLAPNLEFLHPAAFLSPGPFIDIGVPEDYARAQTELPPMIGL